jgi:hypothetical protein
MLTLFNSDAGELRTTRSSRWYAASLILHICCVALLVMPSLFLAILPPEKLRKEKVIMIPLKPPKVLEAQRRKPPKPKLASTPAVTVAPPPPPPARPSKKPAKDEFFAIADDPTHELPKVLAREEGRIGFGEVEEHKYLTYVFGLDGARERRDQPLIRMGDYWALEISDEGGWSLIEGLRQQNKLGVGMVAYALFPPEMQMRVNDEIRRVYQEKPEPADIEHMKVTLAFDASVPLGFKITLDPVARSEP